MNDSILTTIKKLLGIAEDYTQFDTDIIIHINTIFAALHDMGIGHDETFSIFDKDAIWDDFIDDAEDLEMVKSYMYMRVRMLFDTPQASVKEAMDSAIEELEWRMYHKQEY